MSGPLRVWLPAIRAGSGADVFVERLAAGLRRSGHDPRVQWFDHHLELMPWRLRNAVAPTGTDVIHANSWTGFAFKRYGLPLIVTEHQYVAHPAFIPYRGPLRGLYHRHFVQRCMRRSFRASSAVVAVSDFCAAAMRKDLDQPVTVIHNWVDTQAFSPAAQPSDPDRAQGVVRLLFVGNPSRWKGADILPSLASMLGSGFEIACLGGLRKTFSDRVLPPNMTLLPGVAPVAMPGVYRSSDIVLVPTRYEAFGYVALEAMACGLPVVGFDSAGTAEVCVRGTTALLAPVDDVAQLASYVRRLACDVELRARLGAAGRSRAVNVFAEEPAVKKYIDTYRRVIATND